MNAKIGRWIVFSLGLVVVLVLSSLALRDSLGDSAATPVADYKPWDEKTLKIADLIPVQDGGRIKPLSTYASFTMLSLHGARSMKVQTAEGQKPVKILPLAWMMDCFFRPELAKELPTFRVEDSEVLTAAGLTAKARRDYYSFNELEPGIDKLMELGKSYEQIGRMDQDKLEPVQKQTLDLAYKLRTFQFLTNYMGPARDGLMPQSKTIQKLDMSLVMERAHNFLDEIQQSRRQGQPLSAPAQRIAELLVQAANDSKYGLLIFPPAAKSDDKWLSAGDRLASVFSELPATSGKTEEQIRTELAQRNAEDQASVGDIKALEALARSLDQGEEAFRGQLSAFQSRIGDRAKDRGEGGKVGLESFYFHGDFLVQGLVWYLMATVSAAVMFFTGRTLAGKISFWATVAFIVAGLGYVMTSIGIRMDIMQRPPVGNLYDTIIFITMGLTILALAVEGLTRRRFVLGITPIVGALLIVLARRFEVGEARDNLDPLRAVLRSNYWLTVHVLTITLGYSAGLMTSLLSLVYVLLRTLRLDGGDPALRRSLTRAVYGCVCLTALLSLIGTVLGGVWANESWGRFWGWDPKENGALMIVLWSLAILHARLGGYIREWGLHLAALFGANVIGFSWWHVNFLGKGLHSYGFSADKSATLWIYYGVMTFFVLVGGAACLFERIAKKRVEEERKAAASLREAL